MLKILRHSLQKGIVTTDYPASPAAPTANFRGRPVFDFPQWKDARPGANVCPTGAISSQDQAGVRTVTVDYGKCIFCSLCEGPGVTITRECELAVHHRADLVQTARYQLDSQGKQESYIGMTASPVPSPVGAVCRADTPCGVSSDSAPNRDPLPPIAPSEVQTRLRAKIRRVLGRSLHIREVDAGSCNGCEVEIVGLNSPVYDLERLGMHFVASPRHADLLLVTGPVTRNMELALRKTYDATPEPRLVVAVGACGCSGGIFGETYATLGGVDRVLPVDVYIPGCPPRPQALLHGLLLAVERLEQKLAVAR